MKKRYILSLFLVLLLGLFAASQSLEEIINCEIKARGGKAKINSIKTMKIMGKMQNSGMVMYMTIYIKRPNMVRSEIQLQGKKIIQAYDGKTAWWINPMMGNNKPQKMSSRQAEQIKNMDMMDAFINYKKKGNKLEYIGEDEVEGTPAYKIKLTTKKGRVTYIYVDKDSCLIIKQTRIMKRGDNEIESNVYLSDYKEVSGVLMPFSYQVGTENRKMSIIFTKIEANIDLPDSLFVFKEPTTGAKETKPKKTGGKK